MVKPGNTIAALGAVAAVCVLALPGAAAKPDQPDPDGRYAGTFNDADDSETGPVSFTVAKNGRLIKNFAADPLAVCVNPNAIGGIEVVPVEFRVDRIEVAGNGRFAYTDTVAAGPPSDSEQVYELSGRLKGDRVRNGRMALDRRCTSEETFTAERGGKRREASAAAKPPKPPKPPKPKVTLLTVNEQAAVDKRAIKILVQAKGGAEAKASGDVVVDGYPEDFPFELGQVTKPLRNKQAKISFPLSARKIELISFAAATCRGTSITVRAEIKKRVRTISGNLAVPSDC